MKGTINAAKSLQAASESLKRCAGDWRDWQLQELKKNTMPRKAVLEASNIAFAGVLAVLQGDISTPVILRHLASLCADTMGRDN